jgi:alkylhydroperoxidase family enzyme
MLLRESGRHEQADYDLNAITNERRDSGVAHENWLRKLTEQAIEGDWAALEGTFTEACKAMGQTQAVDVLVVASAFNGITRVADATGIPLDQNTEIHTVELRDEVGLNAFDYGEKTARFG